MPDYLLDEQLLERARAGDEAAFRMLYESHRLPLFRFAYRLTCSAERAEDAVHDIFLDLIKNPLRFDSKRASLRTYLFAAVRNQAFKRIFTREEELSDETLQRVNAEARTSKTPEPLRRILEAEVAAHVQQAIAELPPAQREAIVLFEYEGLSLAEIAFVVDADTGTIKSRLHRARARLRERLAAFVADEVVAVVAEK